MREIHLTQGYVAIIDHEDYDRVIQHKWCASVHIVRGRLEVYAVHAFMRNGKKTLESMHRFLLPGSHYVDHCDGNGLNNCRSNLRPANKSQNAVNSVKRPGSSLWRGVSWDRDRSRWTAHITKDNKAYSLGRFKREENAAQAYNFAAEELHGEFSRFNLPVTDKTEEPVNQ